MTTHYSEGKIRQRKTTLNEKKRNDRIRKQKQNFGRATSLKKMEIVNGETKERKGSGQYVTKRRYEKNFMP